MSELEHEVRQRAKPVTGRIFITGATGFVGGNILAALGDRPVRLFVRDPTRAEKFRNSHVELVVGDITKPETLRGAMEGAAAVIHLVAIIEEEGGVTFDVVIRQGTVNVVAEAKRAGIDRFLHMSALGTRNDPRYGYFEAKWQAEQAVKQSGMAWTIFRPSVIFGPGDGFVRALARLVKTAPVIPIVGSGKSKFQPVSVREVAAAVAHALDDPATAYHIYDLGGGRIYTYEEVVDTISRRLGLSKPKLHVPAALMKLIVKLTAPLPKTLRPPVTGEQLKMLDIDNASSDSATAALIGREPQRLEDGIDYLSS